MQKITPVRFIVSLVVSVLCGFLTFNFIYKTSFSDVDSVEIEYEIESDSTVRLLYGEGKQNQPSYNYRHSQVQLAYAGNKRTLHYTIKNQSMYRAQLEIGSATKLTLSKFRLFNKLSKTQTSIKPVDAIQGFESLDDDSKVYLLDKEVIVETNHPNTRIQFNFAEFKGTNSLLLYGTTALITLLSLLISLRFNPLSVPALSDIKRNEESQLGYRRELDGLRGIAALLVILDHTWWRFTGSGTAGVWIFFVLSGFLLSQPFVTKPERALQPAFVVTYIFRRLGRIIPMYLVTLLLMFGLNENSHIFLNHLLFLQAEGHLWTIPQEIFFYLVLPFIVIAIYFLRSFPTMLSWFLCVVIMGAFLGFPEIVGIRLYGYDQYTPPYLGWFMTGICVAYLTSAIKTSSIQISSNHKKALSLLGILMLTIFLAFSSSWFTSLVLDRNIVLPKQFKASFVVLGAFILLLIILSPGTLLSRILNLWPLRAVGIVGYSFYLLHPLVIDVVMQFSTQYFDYELLHARLFIVATIVTWIACLFTYSLIEKPFLIKKNIKN